MTDRVVTPMSPSQARGRLTTEIGHFCFRCRAPTSHRGQPLAVDHIVPVARGGLNVFENYQYLCIKCNSWKGTKIVDFRPGKARRIIEANLPIIANALRVRKSGRRLADLTPATLEPPDPPPPATDPPAAITGLLEILAETSQAQSSQIAAQGETIRGQAYTIAELHADNADLRERVGRAEARVEWLEDEVGAQHSAADAAIVRASRAEAERDALTARLTAAEVRLARPWFRRIFG